MIRNGLMAQAISTAPGSTGEALVDRNRSAGDGGDGGGGVRRLRVATFNLRHGRVGAHWPFLPWRLRQGVGILEADIAGLQELDRRVIRTWFVDQPALSAKAARATAHVFGAARSFGPGGRYGNALLVRGDLLEHEVVQLPHRAGTEPRVAIVATVTTRAGMVTVANTHLQNDTVQAAEQLHALLELLGPEPPPKVLVGDLNLRTHEVASSFAAAGWDLAGGADSSPAKHPYQRIDHIASVGFTIERVEVPAAPVSDHRPVIATLRLPGR
jgi:endonuclease/exonuclease/phosphatase family metal-dependent hydrolase